MSRVEWLKNESHYLMKGELTRETVPQLWEELKQWIPEKTEIELSLLDTKRIDSAGMVMLIHLIQHAKNSNCHIMLCFVPDQLRMLFQLSNIESMIVGHLKN